MDNNPSSIDDRLNSLESKRIKNGPYSRNQGIKFQNLLF